MRAILDRLLDRQELRRESQRATGSNQASPPSVPSRIADRLTSRETEVLQLMALGYTNPQIAGKLIITAHTVKVHVEHILAKLGARNRTEAVVLALSSGDNPRGKAAEFHTFGSA